MQLVHITFKKRIYKSATPTALIAAGDTVNVRLRVGCCSCATTGTGPNVPAIALGCDNLATLDAHSKEILARQVIGPCVGAVVPLVVNTVTADGRGFTFDRTLTNQHFRGSDIDMVMPDHDGVGCNPTSSVVAP